jgi:hypothetical protein
LGKTTKPKRPSKHANYVFVIRDAVDRGEVIFTQHAIERMSSRKVIDMETLHVVSNGKPEPAKDQFKDDTWRYAFKGEVPDGGRVLRVIVGIDQDGAVVVTVIALGEED